MNFFLGAEAQASAAGMLTQLNRIAASEIKVVSDKSYGEELEDIAIITILVQEQFLENGGYKERRLFQRKTHSADIRLRINYKKFMCATSEKRYEMYVQHILDSIACLKSKVSTAFRFQELLSDVREILSQNDVQQACVRIKHFPT